QLLDSFSVGSFAVASDSGGNFTTAWTEFGSGLFTRRYDATGAPLFSPVTLDASVQSATAIAADAAGNTVVTWSSSRDIVGRRVDSAGNAAALFRVNSPTTTTNRENPAVALSGTGRFVVSWDGGDPVTFNNNVFVALSKLAAPAIALTSTPNPATTAQTIT